MSAGEPKAGPSRLPWRPPEVQPIVSQPMAGFGDLFPRAPPQTHRLASALLLLATTFPGAQALRKRSETAQTALSAIEDLADVGRYVDMDVQGLGARHWDLKGRSPQQASSPSVLADTGSSSALTSSIVANSPTMTMATATGASLNVPDSWVPSSRTSFWAVPLIIVMSVVLAGVIVVLIVVSVVVRRKRRRKGVRILEADPERVESSGTEKPSPRRARGISVLRKRTITLRRRGRKSQQFSIRGATDEETSSSKLSERDVSEVVGPALLSRSTTPGNDSIHSVSTVAADVDSFTALTTTADGEDSRRPPSPILGHLAAQYFRSPLTARRSAVSLTSIELVSAPPAYGAPAISRPMSRREQKQRLTHDETLVADPPAPGAIDTVAVDRSRFVGHVATDEKAALAMLADMGSAPSASRVSMDQAMPGAEELERAMIEDLISHQTDTVAYDSAIAPSTLPAPPQPIISSFARIQVPQPSAPAPMGLTAVPTAPPLPEMDGSTEGSDEEGDVIDEREDHCAI